MSLPRYSNPSDGFYSLPMNPPYYIENLSARVLPLRSSLHALQTFVDNHLNIIPPELGRFRAFLPYTYLMMLDYGKIGQKVSNLGWFAQHEIMFSFPVEWYRVEAGQWIFQDWAWVTPFIFVDSALSLSLGRTVYGWPKSLAVLTPTLNAWMNNPSADARLATVSTMVFPERYGTKAQEPRVLLEVRSPAPSPPLRVPIDLGSFLAPWMALGNWADSALRFSRDALDVLAGLGVLPRHPGGVPDNYLQMVRQAAMMTNPAQPDMYFNTLNLKQFRDASQPGNYCHQSLTNAKMTVTAFNRGGFFGAQSLLAGDPSGGLSVQLYRWPSLPIIETLGIEVARQWRGDGVEVAELKPVLPLWYDVNMTYHRGTDVAWRTLDRVWHDRQGRTYQPQGGTEAPAQKLYNTTLGASSQAMGGPFHFSNTSVRVLPLLADKKTLQAFVDNYLNAPLNHDTAAPVGSRFEVWGPPTAEDPLAYVYLLATNYGDVSSEADDVGERAPEEVAIFVPVQWREKKGDTWQLRGLGVVPAFTYVNNTTAMITGSEVLGIPTTKGVFISPPHPWIAESKQRSLLKIATELFPALYVGQKAEERVFLEIREGEACEAADAERQGLVSQKWSIILGAERKRKQRIKREQPEAVRTASVLALEVLANKVPWNLFTLKQFRDVTDSDRACYQSVIKIPRRIEHVADLRELEAPLHVRIHDYPGQPIVPLLGLQTTVLHEPSGEVVHCLQPVRPFSLRMTWTQQLGQRLWYRSGSTVWQGAPPTVGEARAAVSQVEPQLVIETILARAAANQSDDARWREDKSRR